MRAWWSADRRETDRLAVVSRLVSGNRVLDVGGREGQLSEMLGDDVSYFGLDRMAVTVPRRSTFMVADATHLPVRDGAFSTVSLVAVLQYVIDVRGALLEARRVLEPGGVAIVQVPNMAFIRRRATLSWGRFPRTSPTDDFAGGSIRFFTVHDLRGLAHLIDVEVIDITCSGRWRWVRRIRPQLLGADLVVRFRRPAES